MKTVVFAYHDMGCLGIEALLAAGYEISAIKSKQHPNLSLIHI